MHHNRQHARAAQKFSYTLVGQGRLAKHFCHYFDLLNLQYNTWDRHQAKAILAADITLLLISDGAIESFITEHPELQERRLIHCSGSLVTAKAEGVHPLMTFSADAFYDLKTYQQIPLIAESESQARGPALGDLPNPVFYIPQRDRARYHSLCVLSGNFTVLLWEKLFRELEQRWDIPASAAHGYLNQISRNLIETREKALTGPLVRGDFQTIDANLRALEGDAYQKVYQAFVEAYQTERGAT